MRRLWVTDVCRDKYGREIMRGDIVKVYHYTGARRKRYYIYKQALGVKTWPSGTGRMMFSHLDFDADGHYYEDLKKLRYYEIVQSIKCDHEDRDIL